MEPKLRYIAIAQGDTHVMDTYSTDYPKVTGTLIRRGNRNSYPLTFSALFDPKF